MFNKSRGISEDRYYGSDLNKWTDGRLTKKMTIMNIDLLCYKASLSSYRLIESKHSGEELGYQQAAVLRRLAKDFDVLNKLDGLKRGVYIVRGDAPYDTVQVTDMLTGAVQTMTQEELIAFCEMQDIAAERAKNVPDDFGDLL